MGKKGYIFLLLLLMTELFPVYGQTIKLSILKGNDTIGEIKAVKTASDSSVNYHVTSKAEFRVIWAYTRSTNMSEEHRNGILVKSYSDVIMNGDTKEKSEIIRKDSSYKSHLLGKDTTTIHEAITFTAAMLYFEEPVGVNRVFSETYLEFCTLEDTGDHKYKLSLPGGKVNYYHYDEDGKLQEILIHRSVTNLVFKRQTK